MRKKRAYHKTIPTAITYGAIFFFLVIAPMMLFFFQITYYLKLLFVVNGFMLMALYWFLKRRTPKFYTITKRMLSRDFLSLISQTIAIQLSATIVLCAFYYFLAFQTPPNNSTINNVFSLSLLTWFFPFSLFALAGALLVDLTHAPNSSQSTAAFFPLFHNTYNTVFTHRLVVYVLIAIQQTFLILFTVVTTHLVANIIGGALNINTHPETNLVTLVFVFAIFFTINSKRLKNFFETLLSRQLGFGACFFILWLISLIFQVSYPLIHHHFNTLPATSSDLTQISINQAWPLVFISTGIALTPIISSWIAKISHGYSLRAILIANSIAPTLALIAIINIPQMTSTITQLVFSAKNVAVLANALLLWLFYTLRHESTTRPFTHGLLSAPANNPCIIPVKLKRTFNSYLLLFSALLPIVFLNNIMLSLSICTIYAPACTFIYLAAIVSVEITLQTPRP
jgi:hypothetical protein